MRSDPYITALQALCNKVGDHKAVAKEAGVSPDNLWQVLNGTLLPSGNPRGVGPSLRKALSSRFPDWLDGAEKVSAIDVDGITIPQYEVGGAMGKSLTLQGEQPGIIKNMVVSREWAQKNLKSHTGLQNLCIVTGFGDSMKPLFNSGDPLIVDQGIKTCDLDAVYFFRVEDEGFIKRLQRIPGEGIWVLSANKEYKDWLIKKDADFQVFGRVMKAWKSEDL